MDGKAEQAKILIVDDTPENIDVLGAVLKPHYKRSVALNGAKALEIANSKKCTGSDPLGHHDAEHGWV